MNPENQHSGHVRTTLDLPDDLMRAIKVGPAQQDRKIEDAVAELLRRGLSEPGRAVASGRRAQLPLVQCGGATGLDMAPEFLATALLDDEADWSSGQHDAAV